MLKGGNEGETLGPVTLVYDNKVVSIGTDPGPLQILDDASVEGEHGMISYRGDQLLYVNSSAERP